MRKRALWLLAAAAAALGGVAYAAKASPAGPAASPPAEPAAAAIEIVSDRMVVQNAEKWADFLGSVRLTRGDLVMTSEKLRVHYEGDLLNPGPGSGLQDTVRRLVATGRVHIVSGNYVADADQADYDPNTDVLVLLGRPATVTRGENTLAGTRIVLNRREGRAEAEGGTGGRVRARFHAEPGEEKKKAAPAAAP